MASVFLAGVGNEMRRDDGVGPRVALRVARSVGPGVTVLVNAGEPADLIAAWQGADVAILVDAMDAGLEPGASRRIDAAAVEAGGGPGAPRVSGHALPLGNVVALARLLDAMPGRLLIFGVQGQDFSTGEGLTPAVERAVDRLAAEVLDEVAAALAP